MGFFDWIFGKKQKIELNEQELIEAGACPNCWGKQAYDNQYKDYVKDQTKSNINHDKAHQKAFVAQFVETHVSGIKLKKDGNTSVCPACKVKFS